VSSSVNANEIAFTKVEVENAKLSRELSRKLGYPSPSALFEVITHGGIVNCPVTGQDIQRAMQIYGPEIAAIKGKTVENKSIPMRFEKVIDQKLIQKNQTLNVDIMFVNSRAFLISVTNPLGFTMVTDLGTNSGARSKSSIRKALAEQLAQYKSHGFTITTLQSDGEGAIASLSTEIQSNEIVVNPAGPGQHVHQIERKIRE
jgi:hypothetical protein